MKGVGTARSIMCPTDRGSEITGLCYIFWMATISMRYLRLGHSDLSISSIGLGGFSFGTSGWMVGTETAAKILRRAVDLGINYVDTANVYSNGESEKIIGKITEGLREDLIISTKFGGPMSPHHQGFSRKEAEYQLRGSLGRLKTNYVDIFMPHTWFDHLDTGEMLRTLNGMVESGLTRYYGLSNPTSYQLAEADTLASERGIERPQIVQNHYNAIYREDERGVIPFSRIKGITYSPFSPLAAGFLSGKYEKGKDPDSVRSREYQLMRKRYFQENDFEIVEEIRKIAKELGTSLPSVSLAYLLKKGFLPIVGISNPKHLSDLEAAFNINLKDEHIRDIEDAYVPHAVRMGTAGYNAS